jgi:hypothetical protein
LTAIAYDCSSYTHRAVVHRMWYRAQLAAAADPWVRQGRGLFDKLSATSDGPVITVECELSSTKLHTLVAVAVSMYRRRAATP